MVDEFRVGKEEFMVRGFSVIASAAVLCTMGVGCGPGATAPAEAGLPGACQFTTHEDAETTGGKKAGAENVPVIKGYVQSNTGEKVYYIPGAQAYKRARMDLNKGMKFFCTEKEAQEAGWRKSTV
jgi:hypothetical protein